MKKELTYIELNFTKDDLEYNLEMINIIEEISKEIVNFFELNEFGSKVVARFWNSLEDFRKIYLDLTKVSTCPDYVCGFCRTINNQEYIEILSLNEYKKTRGHEKGSSKDIAYLILHEFTHSCQRKFKKNKNYLWLSEGCATTISHQFENKSQRFHATLEEVKFGPTNYNNYHNMFLYVYKTYGKDYILKLFNNFALQERDTPKLYQETKMHFK